MKTLELSITLAYFAGCICLALYFRRKAGASSSAYWGAERSIGVWVNGAAQFSALLSAASFLGFLGLAYKFGWSFTTIAFGVGSSLGFALSLLLVSGPLRRYSEEHGKFTLAAFLSDRFGSATGLAASVFVLLLFPAYIVPQLMGGGLAMAYVLGIDFQYAVMLVGAVFVTYVVIGGMLSMSWTDFAQGILMFVCMVGLSITAIIHFGGVRSIVSQAVSVNPYFLRLHPALSRWSYVGMSLGVVLVVVCSPHIIMRIFTAKDVRRGRMSLGLTSGMSLVFHLVGYLGVAAAALIIAPKLENTDYTYIVVMNRLFPGLIRGVATAGILAAIMSTTDHMLLAAGVEFANNIYRKHINRAADDKRTIGVARIVMVGIGALATVLAILARGQNIGIIIAIVVGGTGSAFAVPLIAGIWWRRANRIGGFLSIVAGFFAYVILLFGTDMPKFSHILISLPVSLAGMIAGSLLTSPPGREKVEFVNRLHEETVS